MTWSSKTKDLGVSTPATSHPAPFSRPHPTGGITPTTTSVSLSPATLFGATARCTYLHAVNPLAVTPESLMIQALTDQHVDDVALDFFLNDSANSFKDFARSYFAGTVAAGLTYLFMIGEGYTWSDHFELSSPRGNSTAKAGPDFVFARPGASDVALVEAKGTLRASTAGIDRIAKGAYRRQIEPHLGFAVGTAIATHGFAVGAWMVPPAAPATAPAAKLYIHHTAPAVSFANVSGGGADEIDASLISIIAGNYAIGFDLVFGPNSGLPLRRGRTPVEIAFRRLEWLGTQWMVGVERTGTGYPLWNFGTAVYQPIFALHYRTIRDMVDRLTDRGPAGLSDYFPAPLVHELSRVASDEGGAVFPDGLAVITDPAIVRKWGRLGPIEKLI